MDTWITPPYSLPSTWLQDTSWIPPAPTGQTTTVSGGAIPSFGVVVMFYVPNTPAYANVTISDRWDAWAIAGETGTAELANLNSPLPGTPAPLIFRTIYKTTPAPGTAGEQLIVSTDPSALFAYIHYYTPAPAPGTGTTGPTASPPPAPTAKGYVGLSAIDNIFGQKFVAYTDPVYGVRCCRLPSAAGQPNPLDGDKLVSAGNYPSIVEKPDGSLDIFLQPAPTLAGVHWVSVNDARGWVKS